MVWYFWCLAWMTRISQNLTHKLENPSSLMQKINIIIPISPHSRPYSILLSWSILLINSILSIWEQNPTNKNKSNILVWAKATSPNNLTQKLRVLTIQASMSLVWLTKVIKMLSGWKNWLVSNQEGYFIWW